MDSTKCSLCGAPNGCGAAQGKDTCWCTAVQIPKEVYDRIPADLKNKVCICKKCAEDPTKSQDLAWNE